MHIEERIAVLEGIVQRLHGKIGHKWFKETNYKGDPDGWKACSCGAREWDLDGLNAIPFRRDLDEEF